MIVKRRNPWPLLMACACLLAPPLAQANLLKLLGIGPQAELARLDERCKVLVDWGGQHLGPRPAPAPRQPFRGAAVAAPNAMQQFPELRLFADERFRPVFGKPFDALQPSERLALYQQNFQACMRSPTYAHAVAQLAQRLGPPFQDTGGMPQMRATLMSAALVTEAVRKMRQGAAGLKPRLDALESQPAGWSAWEQWQAERPGLEADLLYLPDEQQLALQQRLQALGSQILGAAVADLVASAPPASGGMPAWPEIKRRIALLARITDPSAPVQAARTELLARRDALVDGVAAVLRAELDAVPATAAGNAALPAWYGRFNAELPDPELRQLPGAQALWRDFLRRRADQMALMQPQWLARVQAAPDNAALAAMQREMFPLPGDLNTPTGVQINAAMNERREQFHKASVLGAQAQAAPAVAAVESVRPTAATTAGSGEPTAEEMYDALQAKLKQFAANTAELQTQGCGAVKNRSNNPMDAMACLAGSLANSHGGAQPMRISQFQKLACAPASGQPGWVCDYLMGFSGGMVTAMGTLGSMAASGQRSQSRFIRSGTGWISLPMEKR